MDCARARTRDPVEWLETCPEFSGPLVSQVRELILGWAPDLGESIRWNMLCFSGRKLICGLSACLRHVGVTFFRGGELSDPDGLLGRQREERSMIRTLRITRLEDVNLAALRRLLGEAVAIDGEPSLLPPPRGRREPLPVPACLAEALDRSPKAATGFQRLSPSCQREYIVWVSSAKRPETRERRLKETLAAVVHGRKWAQRREEKPVPAKSPTRRRPGKPAVRRRGGAGSG